jgi:hypothetical protein
MLSSVRCDLLVRLVQLLDVLGDDVFDANLFEVIDDLHMSAQRAGVMPHDDLEDMLRLGRRMVEHNDVVADLSVDELLFHLPTHTAVNLPPFDPMAVPPPACPAPIPPVTVTVSAPE